jgi:hypothetical protein
MPLPDIIIIIIINSKRGYTRWQWYYNNTQNTNKHTSHK